MYSHALITYQDSLSDFSQKVAKTFTHVEQSFKGYQNYDFQYIKELAEHNRMFKDSDKKGTKKKQLKGKTEAEMKKEGAENKTESKEDE